MVVQKLLDPCDLVLSPAGPCYTHVRYKADWRVDCKSVSTLVPISRGTSVIICLSQTLVRQESVARNATKLRTNQISWHLEWRPGASSTGRWPERADSGVLRVQAEQTSLFRVQNVAQERPTLITPTVIVMKALGSKQSIHSPRCLASRRLFIQPLTPSFLTNAIFGDRFMNNIDVKT